MIYKIYEGLSDYLIAPDGTPVNKATGQALIFQKSKVGFAALLKTDEVFTYVRGKKLAVRLNRRFTRDQMVKMYQTAKDSFEDKLNAVDYTKQILKIGTAIFVKEEKTKPEGIFIEEAGEITQQQMDQLAASKRTVKSNPKTKKSTVAKVSKAINTAEAGKPLKVPYFEINGQKYQSARKASEAVGVSVNTVLKKAKLNKDGWNFIEK